MIEPPVPSSSDPPAPGDAPARLRAEVRGAVQGVGFRPFVFRLASELELTGWVRNDTRGVFLEVEGPRARLERFLERLRAEAPPVAAIHDLAHAWLETAGFAGFEIRHEDAGGARTAVLLPDLATCPDCLAETREPAQRRFGYAFTNCTNCGPRFSIIRELPYDRPNTSMGAFGMCADCRREYEDPRDRRFHAQPIACPACGPRLAWVEVTAAGAPRPGAADAGAAAVRALAGGGTEALKGLGGYQVLCDAANEAAVAALRLAKGRQEKPFAVMCADVEQARTLCEVSEEAAAVLRSPRCPIVLLPLAPGAPVAANVAPRLSQLGVMLPATPLHHSVCASFGRPLVATSGNLSEEPIVTDDAGAVAKLGGMVAGILSHDRPIVRHVDDSVGTFLAGAFRLLRRARGYAPMPVRVRGDWPAILAVGAHLKNTVALAVGDQVFVSQHIGDLETPEAMGAFERVIEDFLRMYDVRPAAIAHDLHPAYLSTGWALEAAARMEVPLVGVQHHHAHLAACLAEHGADGPALGVTWDGTGWGPNGTVWGGEFLRGDAAGFERVAHLRAFRLPGGEVAVREPNRAAIGLLRAALGPAWVERDDLAPVRAFSARDRALLERVLDRELGSPVTTSAGRLFDAIAALAGLGEAMTFEGQAAMHLEFAADPGERGAYPVRLLPPRVPGGPRVVDWEPMLDAILGDQPSWLPSELRQCLNAIAQAAPNLRQDRRFMRGIRGAGGFIRPGGG